MFLSMWQSGCSDLMLRAVSLQQAGPLMDMEGKQACLSNGQASNVMLK